MLSTLQLLQILDARQLFPTPWSKLRSPSQRLQRNNESFGAGSPVLSGSSPRREKDRRERVVSVIPNASRRHAPEFTARWGRIWMRRLRVRDQYAQAGG